MLKEDVRTFCNPLIYNRSKRTYTITSHLITLWSRSWDRVNPPPSNHLALVSPHLTPSFFDKIQTKTPRDTRKLGEPVLQYVESHSDDITEVYLSLPPFNSTNH